MTPNAPMRSHERTAKTRHRTGFLGRLHRLTSAIPGGRALKRPLLNSATACGMTYWLSEPRPTDSFAVIMYHGVVERPNPWYGFSIPAPILETQLRMFRRFCSVLSLDDIFDLLDRGRPLPPRCVALTFDDGYRSSGTIAWPMLRRERLPATLFCSVQALDHGWLWPDAVRHAIRRTSRPLLVLERLPEGRLTLPLSTLPQRLAAVARLDMLLKRLPNAAKERVLDELLWSLCGLTRERLVLPGLMLSWDEARLLAAEGMDIGAHTITHPILTNISVDEARHEIVQSRRILEERLRTSVPHFAYPNGTARDCSDTIRQLAREAGFRSACMAVNGVNGPGTSLFALRRVSGVRLTVRDLVRAIVEAPRHGVQAASRHRAAV